MNISKISRGIVVVIFVAFIIFLSSLNFSALLSGGAESTTSYSGILKLAYAIAIVILVVIYIYIKDKLYKLKVKRKISFIYRYIYLIIINIFSIFITKKGILSLLSKPELVIAITLLILTSVIVKRIIFNVSKSDMLSVFGMCMSSLLINTINDKDLFFNSLIVSLTSVTSIFILQLVIDELKQKGMKTSKYIMQSALLGLSVGINIVFGINYIVWLIVAITMMFITINLDNTHISFPKKFMASLTQEKRESLYKIERININKLIVSLLITLLVTIVTINILNFALGKINCNLKFEILNNVQDISKREVNIVNIVPIEYAKAFTGMSKTYYMIIFVYILILEFLAFCLNRRYDTKSTIIKVIFLAVFFIISYSNLSIIMYQPVLTLLLIIIAIVNTSNLYLNREERIKLLVA